MVCVDVAAGLDASDIVDVLHHLCDPTRTSQSSSSRRRELDDAVAYSIFKTPLPQRRSMASLLRCVSRVFRYKVGGTVCVAAPGRCCVLRRGASRRMVLQVGDTKTFGARPKRGLGADTPTYGDAFHEHTFKAPDCCIRRTLRVFVRDPVAALVSLMLRPDVEPALCLSGKRSCRPCPPPAVAGQVPCLPWCPWCSWWLCQAAYARTAASQSPAKALCFTRR